MAGSDLTAAELTEAFEYLDGLRASGHTNMWGAGNYIVRDLAWPGAEASAALGLWMTTFDSELSVAQRVAIAIEAQARARKGIAHPSSGAPS